MSPARLALLALLVLGAMCSASARSAHTEQDFSRLYKRPIYAYEGEEINAQAAASRAPMNYPQLTSELVAVEQQMCMGRDLPVPSASVEVCSVTPLHCGLVRVHAGGNTFSWGQTRKTAAVRVCDRKYYATDFRHTVY